MKVIGVACSCLPRSNSLKAVEAFLKGAAEAGHETELIHLNKDLHGCLGCQGCKKEGAGMCVQKDVLTRYFELLPEAGAVVMGAGNYMGYAQGEAWTFMNRHYCLYTGVGPDRKIKIAPGKKFFAVFAQGSPDNPTYREHYEAMCKPFEGWGFDRQEMMIVTAPTLEERLKEAYELGKAL